MIEDIAIERELEPAAFDYIAYTDGGCRMNPVGPASWAWVMGATCGTGFLECASNNVAEYTAVIKALEWAVEHKIYPLLIRSDSELIVKQLTGVYQVHNNDMLPLYERAIELIAQLDGFKIEHISREDNTQADALCDEVLVEHGFASKRKRKSKNAGKFASARQN